MPIPPPKQPPFTIVTVKKCGRCSGKFESADGAICLSCKEYLRVWRTNHKDRKAVHDRTYESKHRAKVNQRFRDLSATDHGKQLRHLAYVRWKEKLRTEMITAYGGCCSCCGEDEPAFLTLEHKNGGGGRHRRELGGGGAVLSLLRKQGWPTDSYTILCWNCNMSTKDGKQCPHQKSLKLLRL